MVAESPQGQAGDQARGLEPANPELLRLALKLATGAGKTTVMAMLIAWQTINAVRRPGSKHFTRGFLVVTPGLTIKDRAGGPARQGATHNSWPDHKTDDPGIKSR
jgi:type III restriction enzyme